LPFSDDMSVELDNLIGMTESYRCNVGQYGPDCIVVDSPAEGHARITPASRAPIGRRLFDDLATPFATAKSDCSIFQGKLFESAAPRITATSSTSCLDIRQCFFSQLSFAGSGGAVSVTNGDAILIDCGFDGCSATTTSSGLGGTAGGVALGSKTLTFLLFSLVDVRVISGVKRPASDDGTEK
jgi:hypothetical protein